MTAAAWNSPMIYLFLFTDHKYLIHENQAQVNLMAGLAAYSFFPKKPMIAVERIVPEENELIQLSLF